MKNNKNKMDYYCYCQLVISHQKCLNFVGLNADLSPPLPVKYAYDLTTNSADFKLGKNYNINKK